MPPRPPPSGQPSGQPLNGQLRAVANYMAEHGLVLTTAESCTAGLIAAHLADVPGAGSLLECAFVAYSPEAKQQRLGVRPETIARCNLTSEAVAGEMAQGALRHSQANLAIANTGVTDGTDPAIAPGTQCFAWFFSRQGNRAEKLFTQTRQFKGERNAIREQAAAYALLEIPARHAAFLQAAAQEEGGPAKGSAKKPKKAATKKQGPA